MTHELPVKAFTDWRTSFHSQATKMEPILKKAQTKAKL